MPTSFYPRVLEKMFSQSCEEPTVKRCLMAFPYVCSEFSDCGNPLCPEEFKPDLGALKRELNNCYYTI
ncbi:hypothetical protein CRUP_005773 [Coryphaenoides rupestris]|nr:hypothetical protein CRUP_005773 [Coryphaenoides rupestris]